MPRSWIVLVSPSYGGAEKRFFDVFSALRRRGMDLGVAGPSSLMERFRRDHPERADLFDALLDVPMHAWSRVGFMRKWRARLATLPRGGNYHYPLNCLWMLHVGRGDRVTMTVADCTSVPRLLSSKRTDAWAWIAFAFVRRIDVLSPAVYDALRNDRARGRMSLTPGGTFLLPPPEPDASARAPRIAWLGRMVPGKGLLDLLDRLPEVWERLRARAPRSTTFDFAGYGELEGEAQARIAALQAVGVPVAFSGYAEAAPYLARSTVLLSTQETTNFPSRVVAEALMAGCAAVVRDTGDTRQFGELPGLEYAAADLDPADLADRIARLLAGGTDADTTRAYRVAAIARFSGADYLDYFRRVIEGDAA